MPTVDELERELVAHYIAEIVRAHEDERAVNAHIESSRSAGVAPNEGDNR